VSLLDLGICWVLHLDPRLAVFAGLLLHHNALEIHFTDEFEEILAVIGVIDVEKMRILVGNELAEESFALEERQRSDVFAFMEENVERREARGDAPKHQIVESRPALPVHTDDLAVEYGLPSGQGRRHMMAQVVESLVGESLVGESLLGNHPRLTAGYVVEGAEPVVLQLVNPVRVVEDVADDGELGGFDAGQHCIYCKGI